MAKILVVDDDPDVRSLVEVRLRRLGHRVVAVGSGEEALEVVADKGAPELFVLDVLMPGMDGLELLQTLRRDHDVADAPVIFLSARIQESDIAAGQALGATYLTKPLVLSALANAVERSLSVDTVAGSW